MSPHQQRCKYLLFFLVVVITSFVHLIRDKMLHITKEHYHLRKKSQIRIGIFKPTGAKFIFHRGSQELTGS